MILKHFENGNYGYRQPILKVIIQVVLKRNFIDEPETYSFLYDLVDSINYSYRNIDEMYPVVTTPYIPDSKIQFDLQGIFFHYDTTLFRRRTIGMVTYGKNLNIINLVQNNASFDNAMKDNTLHVFFVLRYNSIGGCVFGGYTTMEEFESMNNNHEIAA